MDTSITSRQAEEQSVTDLLENIESIEEFTEAEYRSLARDVDAQWRSSGHSLPTDANALRKILADNLKQQAVLQEGRSHGWHKGAAIFQQFTACLSGVLDTYSFVADIAQDSGAPFAKLGFQAIGQLFAAARAKSANDASVYVQLKQISDSFPRLEILKRVYSESPQLRKPFIQMHVGMICWATEAARYLGSRTERLKAVVMGSPTEDSFNKLMNILLQISHWTSVLMQERISNMNRKVNDLGQKADSSEKRLQFLNEQVDVQSGKLEGVLAKLREVEADFQKQSSKLDDLKMESSLVKEGIRDLHAQEEDFHRQKDEDRYRQFKEAFSEGSVSAAGSSSSDLTRLTASVNKSLEFRLNPLGGTFKTQAWSAKDLAAFAEFRKWRRSATSNMLVLGTEQAPQTTTGYSWVSSGPLSFAQELQRQEVEEGSDGGSRTMVALHSCHPDPWLLDDSAPDFVDIAADLVLQIVEDNKALLRHRELRSIDDSARKKWRRGWERGDIDDVVDDVGLLCKLASEARPLHIIVDRLDKCRDFKPGSTDLLKVFERLARVAPNTKILITLWFEREVDNDVYKDFVDSHDVVAGDVRLKWDRVNENT